MFVLVNTVALLSAFSSRVLDSNTPSVTPAPTPTPVPVVVLGAVLASVASVRGTGALLGASVGATLGGVPRGFVLPIFPIVYVLPIVQVLLVFIAAVVEIVLHGEELGEELGGQAWRSELPGWESERARPIMLCVFCKRRTNETRLASRHHFSANAS